MKGKCYVAYRRFVRAVPSLKGLVIFLDFTQGLRPRLKPIPPLGG